MTPSRAYTQAELELIWSNTFWDALGIGYSADEAEARATAKVSLLRRSS